MRIQVDRERCESNGVCEGIAPTLFRIDDTDILQVSDSDLHGEDSRLAAAAAAACPKLALSFDKPRTASERTAGPGQARP